MKLKYLPLIIHSICCSAIQTNAQEKSLTMQDAVLGMRTASLAPDNLKQANWMNTSNTLSQIIQTNNQQYLIGFNADKKNTDTLLSLSVVNKILFNKDSLKTFPTYTWDAQDNLILNYQNKNYLLSKDYNNWKLAKTLDIPKNSTNHTWDESHNLMAYTIDNNLYIRDKNNKSRAISDEKNPNIVYGQSVHRNEFGINGGIFFSPLSNYLAFYRMDESMVADYPIVNWKNIPATVDYIKYPMAGKTSHEVSVGVYNIISGKTIYLNISGPKDQYLTNICWSPDEQFIFVGVLNRGQNHLQWNQYDAKTGNFIKTLFEEKNDKYVEPQHSLYFIANEEFVWMSQRDGYMHLYRYHISGKLLNQVTKGKWLVNGILGYDKTSNKLIIAANKLDPREKHIFAVNPKTGKMQLIDETSGVHNAIVHKNGKFLLDAYQNTSTPRHISLYRNDKKKITDILISENKLQDYKLAQVEAIELKNEDGTTLYGKLIKPKDFNPNKKYPVIVYLYNGPHLQLITNSYPASGNLWYDYMAEKGFIIFTMDGRGSSNRGFDFESATFRNLGQEEMKDQLTGVEYLKTLPFVDSERLGVHGWSFGGFMTTSLMTHYPNVFKVGVAGGPVIDWSMYEVMYTERYMDTPEENQEGFAKTELSSKVDQVKGKLLMIHGADDDVVVWQHSLK
jgi:dipeptidyl-peptidase-4